MASIRDVINFEVTRTIRKKSFWYASFAPPLIILVVLGINYASDHSASKTVQSQTVSSSERIGVVDNSGLINKALLAEHHITIEPSQTAGINAVKADKLDAFIYFPTNVEKSAIQVYQQDEGLVDGPPYDAYAVGLLKQSVSLSVIRTTRNPEAAAILEQGSSTNDTTYKNGVETHGLASIIAPGLFMLGFLMLIVLLAYLMISSTAEEKENRVAEILLTSIKPRMLILGKIMSIFVLGAIQLGAIIVSLVIAYTRFKNQLSLPGGVTLNQIPLDPLQITLGLVFMILGLVMFTGLLVGLGAMFPSANEAGRFLGMMIIWTFLPIYTLASILTSPNALIVRIFTYFPLTAPTTALLRNAIGDLTFTQALPVLGILAVCDALAIVFAVRAFRFGAMEYSRRISFKELLH